MPCFLDENPSRPRLFELDSPSNLELARAELGPNRAILGNVSTITEMLQGSPEKVYAACERCHKTCGRYHIVGTGCETSPMTPAENLRAIVRYATEHQPEQAGSEAGGAVSPPHSRFPPMCHSEEPLATRNLPSCSADLQIRGL